MNYRQKAISKQAAVTQVRPKTEHEVTVWFDSACPLCIREIRLMRRLDSRQNIQFVDVHSSESCPLDTQTLLRRFHAQERGQAMVSGAEAFVAMWRAIPLLRPLAWLSQLPGALFLLERLYLRFLKIRPWLQSRLA